MASKTTYELEVRLGAATSASFKKNLNNAEKALSGLSSLSNKIMAGIAAGVTAAGATATYVISNAVETYTEFEQEMATVQSISGATATEFLNMKEAAMEAGRKTVFTATESASALEYMSLAGWDVNTSIEGLMPILELAAATGKELQTTSDLVTDSMSALKIGVDELDMYLDKLVESNNDANTTSEQLMEALVKAGGASRTLGADLDDTITALGILANNGKKGEEAGTALNSIFVRLAGNAQALKELDKLGVDLWDDAGKFKGFEEGLEQINSAMSRLTDEEKALSLKNIAGTYYYSQMAYLLDAVNKQDGAESSAWNVLEDKVNGSAGALNRMYSITTDTLENAQARLKSAKEDMQIQLVDVFSDDAKEFISWLAEELPHATDSIVAFAEAHRGEFADALEGLGEGIEFLWENGIAAGQWIIKNKGTIVGALKGMAVSIVTIKTAMLGINIAKYFTNPLQAGIAVAGLAVTAIAGVAGAIHDAKVEAVNANLAAHFGDIALSMENIEEVATHIVSSASLTGILNALDEFAELDNFSKTMEDAVKDLEKLNWKVSIGMELTKAEKEDYQKTISDFVSSAQEYALQAQYSVSINMSLAFDENDLEQSNLVTKVNQFYADKYQELSDLGTQLNEAVTNAFNDGLLEIEEIDAISNIQAQMANIEKQLAVGEFEAQLSVLGMDYSGAKLTSDSFVQLQEELNGQVEEATNAYKEAYTKNYAAVTASYNGGYLTDAEYDSAVGDLKSELANEIAEVQIKALEFQLKTITESYSDEIGEYQQAVNDALEHYSGEEYTDDWINRPGIMWDAMLDEIKSNGPDKKSKQAITGLLETMESSIEETYALKDEWDSLSPEMQTSVQNALNNIEMLQGMTNYNKISGTVGYSDGLYRDVANKVEEFDDYANIKGWADQYYDNSYYTQTAAKIENNIETSKAEVIQPAIDGMYAYSQEYLDEVFSQGLSTSTTLDLNITPNYSMANYMYNNSSFGSLRHKSIMHNAKGGIYTDPILTTFAEEGPEAAVPLDGSERAKNLWAKAGQILGMLPSGTRDQALLNEVSRSVETNDTEKIIQVAYNPVVNIQGNATREEVRSALSISLDELRDMLTEIQGENARVSFIR